MVLQYSLSSQRHWYKRRCKLTKKIADKHAFR